MSVELVVGSWAICLWMSSFVWVETSPPIRVDSRTWRAMSWPAAPGAGVFAMPSEISDVSRASENFARLECSVEDIS